MKFDTERMQDARRPAMVTFETVFGRRPRGDDAFDSAVYSYILTEEYERLETEAREAGAPSES